MTIRPSLITSTLRRGLDVTIQASNDRDLQSPIILGARLGRSGKLTLAAGRGLTRGASVATAGGKATLVANDLLTNGVVDGKRDPGASGLPWTECLSVNAGRGAVQVFVRDGAGTTTTTAARSSSAAPCNGWMTCALVVRSAPRLAHTHLNRSRS